MDVPGHSQCGALCSHPPRHLLHVQQDPTRHPHSGRGRTVSTSKDKNQSAQITVANNSLIAAENTSFIIHFINSESRRCCNENNGSRLMKVKFFLDCKLKIALQKDQEELC